MIDHMERLILKGEEVGSRRDSGELTGGNVTPYVKNKDSIKQNIRRSASLSTHPSPRVAYISNGNKSKIPNSVDEGRAKKEVNVPQNTLLSSHSLDGSLNKSKSNSLDINAVSDTNEIVLLNPNVDGNGNQEEDVLLDGDVSTALSIKHGDLRETNNYRDTSLTGKNVSTAPTQLQTDTSRLTNLQVRIDEEVNEDEDGDNDDSDFFASKKRLSNSSGNAPSQAIDQSSTNRRSTFDIVSRFGNASTKIGVNPSTTPKPAAPSHDPVMSGIKQMLTYLKQQVGIAPSHIHTSATSEHLPEGLSEGPMPPPVHLAHVNSSSGRRKSGSHVSSTKEVSLSENNDSVDHSVPLSSNLPRSSSGGVTSATSTVGQSDQNLLQLLKLKEADNKFLQEQVAKLQTDVTSKDNTLNILTMGLKEVL